MFLLYKLQSTSSIKFQISQNLKVFYLFMLRPNLSTWHVTLLIYFYNKEKKYIFLYFTYCRRTVTPPLSSSSIRPSLLPLGNISTSLDFITNTTQEKSNQDNTTFRQTWPKLATSPPGPATTRATRTRYPLPSRESCKVIKELTRSSYTHDRLVNPIDSANAH